MQNIYFNILPNELNSLIATKLIGNKHLLKFNAIYDLNYQEILHLRYPFIYSKIKEILNINTKLNFGIYDNKDVDIFKYIYIDLGLICRSSCSDNMGDIGYFGSGSNFRSGFSQTQDIFAMILLYDMYPQYYKYIENYLEYGFGPLIFADAFMSYEQSLRSDKSIYDAFVYLIDNGKLPKEIVINEPNEDSFDMTHVMEFIIIVDIMGTIDPDNVLLSPSFISFLDDFDNLFDNDSYRESNSYLFAQYKKYENVYFPIIQNMIDNY